MRNKLFFFLTLLCLTALIGTASVVPKVFFPVLHITCSVNDIDCPDIVQSALQPLQKKSLLFTSFEDEIAKVSLPAHSLVSIKKKLPTTLVLEFEPKHNEYVLKLPSGETAVVANNGYAQQSNGDESLPTVTISNHWSAPIYEQHVDPNLHAVLYPLVQSIKKYNIPTTIIQANSPTEIVLQLPDNRTAVASHENTDKQIRKLSIILKEVDLRTIDTGIKTIDVRFRFPVLKT